jgi:hypothetical protein
MSDDETDGMGGRAKVPARRRRRDEVRRPHAVQLWLSGSEYALVADGAGERHMAVGAFAAEVLVAGLRDQPLPASMVSRDVLVALNRGSGEAYRIGVNFNQAVARLHSTGQLTPQIAAYGREIIRVLGALEGYAAQAAASINGGGR